jgi:hypothetical protein
MPSPGSRAAVSPATAAAAASKQPERGLSFSWQSPTAKKPPTQQQQQQRRTSDSILRGLTLGRVLITLWQALVGMPAGGNYHHTLFSDPDQCASVLPASQLMLVLLRAQEQHTIPINSASSNSNSSSNSSSSSSATNWSWMVGQDEPAKQAQAALSAAATLAEAIAEGPREQTSVAAPARCYAGAGDA